MIKMWIRNKLDHLKWAWQRATRGYDDLAVWNVNAWFLEIIPKILTDMNKGRYGHPCDLTDKQWDKIINKMIECFIDANEDTCTKINKYIDDYNKMWGDFHEQYGSFGEKLSQPKSIEEGYTRLYTPSDEEVNNKKWKEITKKYLKEEEKLGLYRDKKLHEGLALFDKYFWNLWD